MKIKVLVIALSLVCGVNAFAQETCSCGEGNCSQEASKGPFLTNSFGSNWFIGGGVGGSFILDYLWSDPNIGCGLILDINGGKWFDPMWGIRTGVKGLSGTHRANGVNDPFNFIYVHGDVMWNLTNQIKGYKADRKFQMYPYLTAGLWRPFDRSKNFTAGLGLIADYALSERLALELDLTGLLVKQASVEPVCICFGRAGVGLATIGVSYKLGKKTGFQTKCEAVAPFVAAAAAAEAAAAAADAAEKESAAQAAAADEKATAAEEKAAANEELTKSILDSYATTVIFDADKWDLSKREKIALQNTAEILKLVPDTKFLVAGYADKQTGYAAYNLKLSKKRAEAVKKALVEYGVAEDQLVTEGKGAVDYRFFNDYKLSRSATISIQK